VTFRTLSAAYFGDALRGYESVLIAVPTQLDRTFRGVRSRALHGMTTADQLAVRKVRARLTRQPTGAWVVGEGDVIGK
jgi:hypothetical protein